MNSDAESSAEAESGQVPQACPTCGMPYPAASDGTGCPVCLLQGALEAGAEGEGGPPGNEPSPPDEGRFDHFAIVQREDGTFAELGRGAMGATYRALDTVLGRAVAIKVIDSRVAAHPEARARFLREARAAARLHHPHIASVFYYGVRKGDGQCFYAMELVEGETVEARLRRTGPLPASEALDIVAQVTRALAAAEVEGVVHRDLKPANLMLAHGAESIVKVIDFGLAKAVALGSDETNLTYGGFVGTPAFASPEQCAGAGVDARSDLYSLGITLWVMLTAKVPFQGSFAEVSYQHRHASLPLEQLQGVPKPVSVLVETLLEIDPARRFQNAAQVLQAISTATAALEAGRSLTRQDLQKGLPAHPSGITGKSPARRGPKKISVARLPVTGSDLFGRKEDLAFLDSAWADPQVNVVSIVAWAGVGKSTLVNHWLRRMAVGCYRSAEFVFGWSFYRQGTHGGTSSADQFLNAALAWFGDPDPRLGTAWEKGERLAKLIAQRRTLLILDGLEPLQHPPGSQEGRLREPALQALLRELAAFNKGLCVITTRVAVTDIADHERTSGLRRDLEQLSNDTGAQLLQALGVKGQELELRSASDEFGGHGLALTLLGSYLADAYQGDIRCRGEVSNRLAHDVRQGAHARKVMESYQTWFGQGPELSILRLLGLFDRPADEKALGALLKPPAIPGLTESLVGLSPTEWRTVLGRLRRAKLLAGEDPHDRGQLDAHPLVREYFGEQLRSQQTEAWQDGNRRLYHHYRALAPSLPDTFRDMETLFLAVICACEAGLFRDALHDIYIPRIQQGDASFAAKVLGARGALLSALAHFFVDDHWGSPVQAGVEGQRLTPEDQLFILMQTGLYLTATRGHSTPEVRLCYERAEALCHSLDQPLTLFSSLIGQWRNSLLTTKLSTTMQVAQRAYSLAQAKNEPALTMGAFRMLAVTFYFSGEFEAAERCARGGVQLWRGGRVQPRFEEVNSPVVVCLSFEALCRWHFGEGSACQTTMAEAITLAKGLGDPYALAVALFHAGFAGHFERKPAEVERLASDLIELSSRQHFAQWRAGAKVFRGWARSASGSTAEGIAWIEEGIADWRALGSTLVVPYWLALKAEALHLADRFPEALKTVRQAEALADTSGECWWCAELHRLRGAFLVTMGANETEVALAFHQAIRLAEQQKSVSLQKRAQASHAEHRSRTGRA